MTPDKNQAQKILNSRIKDLSLTELYFSIIVISSKAKGLMDYREHILKPFENSEDYNSEILIREFELMN